MRRINLLPNARRREAASLAERVRFLRELPPKTWTVVIAGVVILITIVLAYSVAAQKSSVESKLRTARADLESLRPVVMEVEDLRRLKSILDAKMDVIDRLVIGRLSWARKLYQIADLLNRTPEISRNVWLTGLKLTDRRDMEERTEVTKGKDGKTSTTTKRVTVMSRVLEMEGVLPVDVSTGMVSDLMRMMKEDSLFFQDFSKVQLDHIQDARGSRESDSGKAFMVSLFMKRAGDTGE